MRTGETILDWIMEAAMPWVVIAIVVCVCAAIPAVIYAAHRQSQSPSFTLYKSEWACTNMQRIQTTTYVQSSNALVPITSFSDECHQWSRQP
jgi:hypothetical protein